MFHRLALLGLLFSTSSVLGYWNGAFSNPYSYNPYVAAYYSQLAIAEYQARCQQILIQNTQLTTAYQQLAFEQSARAFDHYKNPPRVARVEVDNLLWDVTFLETQQEIERLGVMHSQYDPDLDSTIHFTASATPSSLDDMPVVDPGARGLIFYFPGAGVKTSTGANFNHLASHLAKMGFATIAIDYPYQKNGSKNSNFFSHPLFMRLLFSLIYKYRVANLEDILVGHSFGAPAIIDLLKQNPFITNHALCLSSPSFHNQELKDWFQNHTLKKTKTTGLELDPLASMWVGRMFEQMIWSDSNRNWAYPDPTLTNLKLKLRFLWGANDEFIPGPVDVDGIPLDGPRTYDMKADIRAMYQRVSIHEEPGIGHLIMGHKDAEGRKVPVREILSQMGYRPSEEENLINRHAERPFQIIARAGQQYFRDPYFRRWLEARPDRRKIVERALAVQTNESEHQVNRLLGDFRKWREGIFETILVHVRGCKSWAPKFFEDNIALIENSRLNKDGKQKLLSNYRKWLLDDAEASAQPKARLESVGFEKSLIDQ